jgi:hypothetical protein
MAKNVQQPRRSAFRHVKAGRNKVPRRPRTAIKKISDQSGRTVVVAKAPEGDRVEVVLKAAARSGLLLGKSGRISGRVSPALVEEAKRRTGIETDSDLIAFALANVALKDDFAKAFKDVRGTIGADLKLGF